MKRRDELDSLLKAVFEDETAKEELRLLCTAELAKKRRRRLARRALFSAAACLVLAVIAAVLVWPGKEQRRPETGIASKKNKSYPSTLSLPKRVRAAVAIASLIVTSKDNAIVLI